MKNMDPTFHSSISTFGLEVKLTRSQNENFRIIEKHWKQFNLELKKYQLNQQNSNWVKYGITYMINHDYYYFAAIPNVFKHTPSHFKEFVIKAGNYVSFFHQGKLNEIKNTYSHIYQNIVPFSEQLKKDETNDLIHYEFYDHRFNWNQSSSIIEIILPAI